MSVHYKFKSSLDYDTVTFDGLHISTSDLKKSILQQKKIGKSSDFDLQVTNAQTKEVYEKDDDLIPKNTSVIISRIPLANVSKKSWDRGDPGGFQSTQDSDSPGHYGFDKLAKTADLVNANATEDEKIKAMMSQSGQEYDPSKYVKSRSMTGPLPPNYTCYRCGKPGHWIKNCPTNNIEVKRSTGIPRSFMMPVDGPDHKGALLTSTGEFAVPIIDAQAYKEVKKEKPPFLLENNLDPEMETQIPEDLFCTICRDLLNDAVLIPCCGASFCDECVRQALLDSENHECLKCHETGVSPDTLVPSRFLRNSVLNFKNETGYTRSQKRNVAVAPTPAPTKVEVLETPLDSSPFIIESLFLKDDPPSDSEKVEEAQIEDPVETVTNSNEESNAEVELEPSDQIDNGRTILITEEKVGPLDPNENDVNNEEGDTRASTPLADEPSTEVILPDAPAEEMNVPEVSSYDPSYQRHPKSYRGSHYSPYRYRRGDYSGEEGPTEHAIATISTITTMRGPNFPPTVYGRGKPSYPPPGAPHYPKGHYGYSGGHNRSPGRKYGSPPRHDSYRRSSRAYPSHHSSYDRRQPYYSHPPSDHRPSYPDHHSSHSNEEFPSHHLSVVPHHHQESHQGSTPPPPGVGQPPSSFPSQPPPPGLSPLSHQSLPPGQPPPPGVGPPVPLQSIGPPPPPVYPPDFRGPPPQILPNVPPHHHHTYPADPYQAGPRRLQDKMDEFARQLMEHERHRRVRKSGSRDSSRHRRPSRRRRSRSRSYRSSRSYSRSRSRSRSRSYSVSRSCSRSSRSYSYSRSRSRSYSRSRSRTPRRHHRSRSHSRSRSGSYGSGSRSPSRRKYRSPHRHHYYHRSRSKSTGRHAKAPSALAVIPKPNTAPLNSSTAPPAAQSGSRLPPVQPGGRPPLAYHPHKRQPPHDYPEYYHGSYRHHYHHNHHPPGHPPPAEHFPEGDRQGLYRDRYGSEYDGYRNNLEQGPGYDPNFRYNVNYDKYHHDMTRPRRMYHGGFRGKGRGPYPSGPHPYYHHAGYSGPRDQPNTNWTEGAAQGEGQQPVLPSEDKNELATTQAPGVAETLPPDAKVEKPKEKSHHHHHHRSKDRESRKDASTKRSSKKIEKTKKHDDNSTVEGNTAEAKGGGPKASSSSTKKEHKHRHKKSKSLADGTKKKKKKSGSDEGSSQITGSESEKSKKRKGKKKDQKESQEPEKIELKTIDENQLLSIPDKIDEEKPESKCTQEENLTASLELPNLNEPDAPKFNENQMKEASNLDEEELVIPLELNKVNYKSPPFNKEATSETPLTKSETELEQIKPITEFEKTRPETEFEKIKAETENFQVPTEEESIEEDESTSLDTEDTFPAEDIREEKERVPAELRSFIPEISKWEREEFDDATTMNDDKKQTPEEPVKKSLSTAIIQKAENVILQKGLKTSYSQNQTSASNRVRLSHKSDIEGKHSMADAQKEKLSKEANDKEKTKTEGVEAVGSDPKALPSEIATVASNPKVESQSKSKPHSKLEKSKPAIEQAKRKDRNSSQDRNKETDIRKSAIIKLSSSRKRSRSRSRERYISRRSSDSRYSRDHRYNSSRRSDKSSHSVGTAEHSRSSRLSSTSSQKHAKDANHDESKFVPNYDGTSDSDASGDDDTRKKGSVTEKSKSIISEKSKPTNSEKSKKVETSTKSSSKGVDKNKPSSEIVSKKYPKDSQEVKPKVAEKKSESSVSSSSSDSDASDTGPSSKKKRSESPSSDPKYKAKRSKHKKHKKHKHKHKRKKDYKSRDKDDNRIQSSVVRR